MKKPSLFFIPVMIIVLSLFSGCYLKRIPKDKATITQAPISSSIITNPTSEVNLPQFSESPSLPQYSDFTSEELLDYYWESDGAYAEGAVHEFSVRFISNPLELITLISAEDMIKQMRVLFNIAAYPFGGEPEELELFDSILYGLNNEVEDPKLKETIDLLIELHEQYKVRYEEYITYS